MGYWNVHNKNKHTHWTWRKYTGKLQNLSLVFYNREKGQNDCDFFQKHNLYIINKRYDLFSKYSKTHQLAFRTGTLPPTTSHTLCRNSHLLLGISVPQAKCSLEFPLLCRIVPYHPEEEKQQQNNCLPKPRMFFIDPNNQQNHLKCILIYSWYMWCDNIHYMLMETECDTLFIFMQVPKSASFKWPALSSNMLSGFTSLRRQK